MKELFVFYEDIGKINFDSQVTETLGSRSILAQYSYGDLLKNIFYSKLIGGDTLDDLNVLKEQLQGHPRLSVPSPDTDTTGEKYTRKRDKAGRLLAEHYIVWSPQGIINLHYPERWGYIMFADQLPASGFLSKENEALKLLWKYYYLQQEFKNKYGKYAGAIGQLDSTYLEVPPKTTTQIQMEATNPSILDSMLSSCFKNNGIY